MKSIWLHSRFQFGYYLDEAINKAKGPSWLEFNFTRVGRTPGVNTWSNRMIMCRDTFSFSEIASASFSWGYTQRDWSNLVHNDRIANKENSECVYLLVSEHTPDVKSPEANGTCSEVIIPHLWKTYGVVLVLVVDVHTCRLWRTLDYSGVPDYYDVQWKHDISANFDSN